MRLSAREYRKPASPAPCTPLLSVLLLFSGCLQHAQSAVLLFMSAAAPLSGTLPQPQTCVRSGRAGLLFLAAQAERALPDGSHPPIFIKRFPRPSSLHS
jgi:hypothetical protein